LHQQRSLVVALDLESQCFEPRGFRAVGQLDLGEERPVATQPAGGGERIGEAGLHPLTMR